MKNTYPERVIRFLPLFAVFFVLVGIVSFRGQIITAIKKDQIKDSPASGELLSKTYIDRAKAADGKFHAENTNGVWFNREIPLPTMELAAKIMNSPASVLGESTEDKWIEVDLDRQRLYARKGGEIVYDMAVSTGLPWMPTVTGDFRIWGKVRAQRMTGGSMADGTFYDLPNVPFVQFFYGGYSLHGTYWHQDFGKPRSHGCVNLSIADAEKLYYWTDPQLEPNEYARYNIKPETSTRILVHGTTPTNIN